MLRQWIHRTDYHPDLDEKDEGHWLLHAGKTEEDLSWNAKRWWLCPNGSLPGASATGCHVPCGYLFDDFQMGRTPWAADVTIRGTCSYVLGLGRDEVENSIEDSAGRGNGTFSKSFLCFIGWAFHKSCRARDMVLSCWLIKVLTLNKGEYGLL